MVNRFGIIVNSSWPGRTARPLLFLPPLLRYGFVPIKAAPLTGICSSFGQTAGHLLFVGCDTRRGQGLSGKYVLKGIIRAGRKAARLGARIIGIDPILAGFLGNSAVNIARRLGLTITSGAGYTAAAVIEALHRVSDLMGLCLDEAVVLILGAAETPGPVCAQILARDGVNYLTLVDSDSIRMDNLARRVLYDSGVACKISMEVGRAVARADLVIVASDTAGDALRSRTLKPGAIVCNLGARDSLSLGIMKERPDVMVFDGVAVGPPGRSIKGCDLGLPGGSIHAWMAEAIILALEGRYDRYFMGKGLRFEKVAAMRSLALKHGFSLSGFTAANHFIDFDGVKEIKNKLCIQSVDNETG